jgi:hypothetical protein
MRQSHFELVLLQEKLALKWKRRPGQPTWQRLLRQNIDAAEFDERVGRYFQSLSAEERRLYNLDGKVVCGTVDPETGQQLYFMAVQEAEGNAVVAPSELAAGEYEISGGRRLLAQTCLENKIISGDAIFAQQELSRIVVEQGGEYLWKLRANKVRCTSWRWRILPPWKINIWIGRGAWRRGMGGLTSGKSGRVFA